MWEDHARVWLGLLGDRDIPLLGLIVALDGLTGLSRLATRRLKSIDARDLVLLICVGALFLYFQIYGGEDFLPWQVEMGAVNWIDDSPSVQAARRAYEHRGELRMMYIHSFHVMQFVSALTCAVLARLQGRSYFIWMAMGYMGNWGAVVWLLLNRRQARSAIPRPVI